jgi:toxin ParE1/3/4
MKSSRRLRFTLEAEEDLRQILQYTREMWDEEQRNRYGASLERVLALLADFPDLGRKRIGDQVLSYRAREHVIYYSSSPTSIVVLRVLHKKQDLRERELPQVSED